ncbi:hypothetical protein SHL15_9112 [Streptomyces hygroscopicus subsp. limoneus]|nr:hypothetical protein SHL15_9112 [Streptomyces hygroscopicus subsp. limoneus]
MRHTARLTTSRHQIRRTALVAAALLAMASAAGTAEAATSAAGPHGTAATAGPAPASGSAPARACTVDAPRFTSYAGTGPNDPAYWPARGTYATTTSRCGDINLKLDTMRSVRTCFKSGSSWTCNGWRTLSSGSWGLAAKDVLDGTKFFLQFSGTARASGLIDY